MLKALFNKKHKVFTLALEQAICPNRHGIPVAYAVLTSSKIIKVFDENCQRNWYCCPECGFAFETDETGKIVSRGYPCSEKAFN